MMAESLQPSTTLSSDDCGDLTSTWARWRFWRCTRRLCGRNCHRHHARGGPLGVRVWASGEATLVDGSKQLETSFICAGSESVQMEAILLSSSDGSKSARTVLSGPRAALLPLCVSWAHPYSPIPRLAPGPQRIRSMPYPTSPHLTRRLPSRRDEYSLTARPWSQASPWRPTSLLLTLSLPGWQQSLSSCSSSRANLLHVLCSGLRCGVTTNPASDLPMWHRTGEICHGRFYAWVGVESNPQSPSAPTAAVVALSVQEGCIWTVASPHGVCRLTEKPKPRYRIETWRSRMSPAGLTGVL